MPFPQEPQRNLEYLSLAILAQNVIAEVLDVRDGLKQASEVELFSKVVTALSSLESQSVHQIGQSAFQSYEQVHTVLEAWPSTDHQSVIDDLEMLKSASPKSPNALAICQRLLKQLSKLEGRAMWNFEHPTSRVPTGLKALCHPVA